MSEYRIDYERVDVADLMRQVRERARAATGSEVSLPELRAEIQGRLRDYLDLDEAQPYELQRALGLTGAWNVSPEDLRRSRSGPVGAAIHAVRRLARPLVKLFVNPDEPLHKQFKINLGIASAIHDLMEENAALRRRVDELHARLDGEAANEPHS